MSTAQILRRASELPWCQNVTARNEFGIECDPVHHSAIQFDPHGAITRAALDLDIAWKDTAQARDELEAYVSTHMGCSVRFWSDMPARTQEAVQGVLRQCADLVEKCERRDQPAKLRLVTA